MSYQVLARKWRPQKFSELVGQEHVVNAITNALENNKLHHAYLFTGTRGVGKTTIARIFSKSLNCEQGQSANPCGKCPTCIDISDGRYVDLLEIDAASRTKVEDTRELLDNVQYRPTRGKYKVYLIDEVHMLSKHSFNALLKTLEEPPEHVKFLLATTDPQKLPVTILSRCLQFNLKALSKDQIHKHLAFILEQEGITFETNALEHLSKAAQGSIRDSLSLTDQAIAQGNNNVSFQIVANMLGLLNRNQLIRMLKFIVERDGYKSLEELEEICAQSPDYPQILSQLIVLIHQIALTQVVPEICRLENESARAIYTLAKSLSKEHIQVLYQIGVNGKRDLAYAPDAKTGLEMTVLRMLAFSPMQQVPINLDDLINSEPTFENQTADLKLNVNPSESLKLESTKTERFSNSENPSSNTNNLAETTTTSDHYEHGDDVDVDLSNADSLNPSNHKDEELRTDELGESPSSSLETTKNRDLEAEPIINVENHHKEEQTNKITDDARELEAKRANQSEDLGAIDNIESESLNSYSDSPNSDLFDNHPVDSESHVQSANNIDRVGFEAPDLSLNESENSSSSNTSKSSYMRTLELLRAEKEIDDLSRKNENVGSSISDESNVGKAEDNKLTINTDFEFGQLLKQFEGDLSAYLKNGEKLMNAAQVDEWSAFVESTNLQAYSRLFLLNTNCMALTNPLKLKVSKDNMNMCTSEVRKNIEDRLSAIFNQKIELELETTPTKNTPYSLQQQIKNSRLAHAREIVNTDNNIQELKKAFDANILQESIEVRPKK